MQGGHPPPWLGHESLHVLESLHHSPWVASLSLPFREGWLLTCLCDAMYLKHCTFCSVGTPPAPFMQDLGCCPIIRGPHALYPIISTSNRPFEGLNFVSHDHEKNHPECWLLQVSFSSQYFCSLKS